MIARRRPLALLSLLTLSLLSPGCFLDRSVQGAPPDQDDDGGPGFDGGPPDREAGPRSEDAGPDGATTDGDVGDPDGGPGDAGVDGGCDSTAPPACDPGGGSLLTCVDGTLVTTPCGLLGCGAVDGVMACRTLVPSNVGTEVAMDAGSADLVVAEDETWTFNTDDGSIVKTIGETTTPVRAADGASSDIAYQTVAVEGAPTLGVFVVHSLDVETDATIRAVGANPFVLLVTTDASVAGTIDVSSDGRGGGPGASSGGGSGSPGQGTGGGGAGVQDDWDPEWDWDQHDNDDSGGGGGGYGTAGGAGGKGNQENGDAAEGGSAGDAHANSALVPLIGGSGGGGGGDDDGGDGGGGGGAVQISAGGILTISGVIDAGGGGGRGGGTGNDSGAGGGGGSGGAILLEAVQIMVSGAVAANGGAGGQGANGGNRGQDGDPGSATVAPGSMTRGVGGGGGHGSDGSGMAGVGASAGNGGGGGGGAGQIRLNALGTSDVMVTPGTISPMDPSIGTITTSPPLP